MNVHTPAEIELREVASSADFALTSASMPQFFNPVLFQLMRLPVGSRERLSLLAVYREGDMTFDAACELSRDRGEHLASVLRSFIGSDECAAMLMVPMRAAVEVHFGRATAQR